MTNKDERPKLDQICPSPQFPSPTDCLPENELIQVLEQIRDANDLLLDLALSDDRPPHETYQKAFDGLMGLSVEIKNKIGETFEGVVTLVGYNFIVLRREDSTLLFPFKEIGMIKPSGKYADPYPEQQLRESDPVFRRDLTFHFGETVASSPKLIQLFFRIRLVTYLLLIEEGRIQITIDDSTFDGLIKEANKEIITLDINGDAKAIPTTEISLITITP